MNLTVKENKSNRFSKIMKFTFTGLIALFILVFVIGFLYNNQKPKDLGLDFGEIFTKYSYNGFKFTDEKSSDGAYTITTGENTRNGVLIRFYNNFQGDNKISVVTVRFSYNLPQSQFNGNLIYSYFLEDIFPSWNKNDMANWLKNSIGQANEGNVIKLSKEGKTLVVKSDTTKPSLPVIECDILANGIVN